MGHATSDHRLSGTALAGMKTPHLGPALAALVLLLAGLLGGSIIIQTVVRQHIHALAPLRLSTIIKGSAIQRIALQEPDLLLVYGSSEMIYHGDTYGANAIFGTCPTGFIPFQIQHNGATSLMIAQAIASLGHDLRGKKVVISFTPAMFHVPTADKQAYVSLFSHLYANELAFSTDLSLETKQLAAGRMREYPKTLKSDPLLSFALEKLDDNSWLSRVQYYVVWPLGKLQTAIIELQDEWDALQAILTQPDLPPETPCRPATLNWPLLETQARQEQIASANSNPYGIDNEFWVGLQERMKQQIKDDTGAKYIAGMQQSDEWLDLEILLKTLTELGAQPLLLSRPINGTYFSALGVTAQARQTTYYDRLRQLAQRYAVPVVDFQDHDMDKYFSIDPTSHTSRLGWIYVDQTLDAFYHGTLR